MKRTIDTVANGTALWGAMADSWLTGAAVAARWQQTAVAAEKVVAARTAMMREALVSPATADHGELALMAPEKIAAFGAAGSAMLQSWLAAQTALLRQSQSTMRLISHGRPPSPAEWQDWWSDLSRHSATALQAASHAARGIVEPIARSAIGNARRLA